MQTTYHAIKRDYLTLKNSQYGGNDSGYIYVYHKPDILTDDYTFISMMYMRGIGRWEIQNYLGTGTNPLYSGSDVDQIEKIITDRGTQYYLVVMKNIDKTPIGWTSRLDLSGAESFYEISTGIDLIGLLKIKYTDKLQSDKPFDIYIASKTFTNKYPNIPIHNIDDVKAELNNYYIGEPKHMPQVKPTPNIGLPYIKPQSTSIVTASEVITEIRDLLTQIYKEFSVRISVSLGCARLNFIINSYEGILKEYIKNSNLTCMQDTDQVIKKSMIDSIEKITNYKEIFDNMNIPNEKRQLSIEDKRYIEDIKGPLSLRNKIIDKINELTYEK